MGMPIPWWPTSWRAATVPDADRARYRRLIEAVQAGGSLWIAQAEELVLILPNAAGEQLILVWPSAEAASEYIAARPQYAQFRPVSRPLARWLESSTPHLAEDGVFVAPHPDVQSSSCLQVPARNFARDLAAVPTLQGADLSRLRQKLERKQQREKAERGQHS